jgi:hypothetical protein
VSSHPAGQPITYGANASFSATASGTPTPTIQWQVSANAGGTWSNLTGATSSPLNLTKPSVDQNGNLYRAVFTNTCSGTQTATTNPALLSVAAKNLTISGADAQNKVYDGTTGATVNFGSATLSDVESGDTVTIISSSYTASFANKAVGSGKPVTVTGVTLGGTHAANYTVTQPTGLTADITAKELTGHFTAGNKTYDGTTDAAITDRSLTGGVVGSEFVSLSGGSASFNNK